MAPKIFGGMGKSPVTGILIDEPDEAIELNVTDISRIGDDLLIESEVKYKCSQE